MKSTRITSSPNTIMNSAELAVALFCHGIKVDPSCELNDAYFLHKRRAGLGSGIELIIEGAKNIWVNVPVKEKFVQHTPYKLQKIGTQYQICHSEQVINNALLKELPSWYSTLTSSGAKMSEIGILQGTYLGIYLGKPCAFWQMEEKVPCKFCATGLNVGIHEKEEKTIEDVVETALAAKKESKVAFVHFNSGYQQEKDLQQILPFVQAIKKEVGALVGVQCIPAKNLQEYDELIQSGVDHFSFCYEFHNPEYFKQYLPGKDKYIGQDRFFRALQYVSKKMPTGSVSGEIIAGIEPIESTFAAIDYITSIGAFPTVCIFRPLCGAVLQEHDSPDEKQMLEVFKYVAQRCWQRKIPVGLAPNLEVSLVMTPDDCRYLLPRDFSWYLWHYKLQILKLLATPYFWLKRNRHFCKMKNK